MRRLNPTAVLLSTIILSVAIGVWGVAFNRATIQVASELDNLEVQIGANNFECMEGSCSYKVKPQRYEVKISKTGFTSETEEVDLERGDLVTVSYEPLELPDIEASDEQITDFDKAFLRLNDGGEHILWVKGISPSGENQVTRFPNALTNPEVRVNTTSTKALVWENTAEKKFWIIDVNEKSKEDYEFTLNDLPTDLKFISRDLVVLEVNAEIYVYNIISGEKARFPIANLTHVAAIEDGKILVISKSNLDDLNENSGLGKNLLDLVQISGDELLESASGDTAVLYYFIEDTKRYVKLLELDEDKYGNSFKLRVGESKTYLDTNTGSFSINL